MASRASWLTVVVLGMIVAAVGAAAAGAGTIDAELRSRLEAGFTADFVVRFAEQADLSAAYRMGWHERGEFVVASLREVADRSQAAARAILDARGTTYRPFLAGNEIHVRGGDVALATALAGLAEVAEIRAARELFIDPVVASPSTEGGLPELGWGLVDSGATSFWSTFGLQGEGIVLAEMSTGVQWNHPALINAYHCGSDPADPSCWFDPSNICGGSMCDNNGYGTAMAGIMAGSDDPGLPYQVGMAPDAEWIACKACESVSCSSFAIESCADWLLQPAGDPDNRPHVVIVPWGGGGGNPWFEPRVTAWRTSGIFPSMQAGNGGSDCNTMTSPGDYQESFAAAAHDDTRTVGDFSSRGPSAFGHELYTKPSLSAPGVGIWTASPADGWTAFNGTGVAAAHVAGAVALLWSCNVDLVRDVAATFDVLQATTGGPPAGNCGAPPDGEGNYTYGYSYLNIIQTGIESCSSLPFSDGFESGDTTAWSATVP
ncbi:MAG TPA: S8 family serine peptidase [Thermoanaerobaculales bacterium]|nr:S8 family serine peptidase [Thermoanaerobaculales bacterium]HPA82072.1 S8 family serine peptidase [Thermoanaerobaculales bacterium]HQL30819.1 S8 family serine peptidase [Thermoanaerobaculales bacterium]HQP43270.1 S8 family serine peptidase [Thermoanaerobaculales bacterium]